VSWRCWECEDTGLIPWVEFNNPKKNDDVTRDDVRYAVCICDAGQRQRENTNEGRKVIPQWRFWCAKHDVDPSRVSMVEDVYSAEELAAAGFPSIVAVSQDIHTALLAAGKKAKS
jgi:hypothetical protein